ncbi:MAG TPA: hypothetical protein VEU51_07020 [Candidatus Acidoferrales bacterium]|nr:hypothetical protein [Candidatus Acidoferrales bacterium]
MSNERLLSLRDRAAEILLKLHELWTGPRTPETSAREHELGAELTRVTDAARAEDCDEETDDAALRPK